MRLVAVLVAAAALLAAAAAHEHHGEAPTCSGGSARVLAEFRPGEVTVDGHSDDWDGVEASEFALLPALDPDEDKAYSGGKVAVKAVHDGVNVFFMLQVDGAYAYSKGKSSKCPSVALMFQVGDNATYYNMGGCKDMPGSCTSKSCRGHEVDIMHFEIGNAIPGRLYGGNHIDNAAGNGGDRFGHLVDVYAWNPHCRYLDGLGPKENNSNAQNDWHGAWWHSSLTVHSGFVDDDNPYGKQDEKGTYYFEFSRPLRTMDQFQQDAQFTIGQPSNMAVAFWYPTDGKEWSDSEHYSSSCNWLILDIQPSSEATYYRPAPNRSWDAVTGFALLLSVVTAALAAAGESGGSNARDSDPATDGEGEVPEADANEAVDLGDGTAGYSSSDEESDDGLHIVLNEDAGAPPPVGRGEGCVAEGEDGEDSGSRMKVSSVEEGGWATVGGLQCQGLLEKTTLPIMGQVDRDRQHVFQRDYKLFLPRNSTIFDIDIEALQQKPWRQQGVDLTDYFNFNLDEEGWRKYWCSMKQLRLGTRSLANETSGLDQESYKLKSVKAMPKAANYSGFEGRNSLAKPKGRAIHVEGSAHERVPSADLWRPIQRDSDVVIQVNMTLSPSNQSTSDDSSKLNHKCVTTERRLKGSSFVVDRVVEKEVHDGDSSEFSGSKLDRRDSSCARAQSFSPDYSDTLSGESKEDFYFKRANRHSDSRDFFEDTKLQDEHVKSDFYRHSSKSDRENSESRSRSYTPSPADDRNHKATKLFQRGEAPFDGRGKSSDFFVECNSDHDLVKSGRNARKELKRQSVDGGRYAIFVEKEKSTDRYPSRYGREYEKRRSSLSSLRTNYHNAGHNQIYEKQGYSHLERVGVKNDKHYFSNESNHHHRRSSSHEINDGEDVEKCFSSAKEWQQHHDHAYQSMLNADMSDADDGQMYRERYCQEKRRARHDHSVDGEFPHYTDYGFCERQSPEVRGRYRDKGRFAKSNDEHFRHANHLELYPSRKNSERDWPAAGFPFQNSRNICIDNKRIHNAKMVHYHRDGYHQKNNGNIPRSALCSDTVAEAERFILPVKRKLHADLGSMNQKCLADLSLLKGRRLVHDQSILSDRRIYALRLHKFTDEIDTKAICNSDDMRNSNTVSNICIGRRHELENADNILLNDRKIKFERRGNELRRVIEDDQKGCIPVAKDLHSSKQQHVHQNARKQSMGYHHLGNQDLKKSAHQNRQNEEDGEIEEGELIEQDHQDIISTSKLKPRKVVLKSVIETSSAEQPQVNDAMAKDAVCTNGATRECDKHILEIMEKMQKRRERFKEAIAPKKDDGDKKELSAVACSTDRIQNQRPLRKRRWGGNS
ncbi:FIP1[III]-like protein [Setaria italica]